MNAAPLNNLRHYFESGATKSYSFRKDQLKKLKQAVLKYEYKLYDALRTDLKKSPEESWVTELGMVIAEINVAIKELRKWMKPNRAGTNLLNFPSVSYVMNEPMGVVMIIAPWNYPFQLLINPLVGAIAAGNCVVLKASEFAPATDAVMKKMIEETFPKEYILYAQGEGAQIVPQLMNQFRFDFVFYTGSTAVGKIIYKMAAEKLIPVTLELGGKSPCVVERDANIKVAAQRIGITKFSAAGQMCVAPDYILVHESVKEKFINALRKAILIFFSEKPEQDYNYCKIINEKQFNRLISYLKDGTIVYGGRTDKEKLFIEPTILENIAMDSPVMKEEIFGPILPVISFKTMEEAKLIILKNPNPLSFYIYTSSRKKEKEWLSVIPAGGACINNSSWHLTNHHLPFGGRGLSGIGYYHGKYSFDTFSHKKAVMKTPTWFNPKIKYPPFKGKLKIFKWIIK
ncbi:MAG: aldehyde dehydrogenase [Bacteroidetes bacterium]|nr:aldehyde dehydrogenase [Bacteroidota bacterium]MBS1931997.1 aldehyde dehydrogenase [Bacteroidota bacterium]